MREAQPDDDCATCSAIERLLGGCKWYHTLSGTASKDWGVRGNPRSHRAGLLTFEDQGVPRV